MGRVAMLDRLEYEYEYRDAEYEYEKNREQNGAPKCSIERFSLVAASLGPAGIKPTEAKKSSMGAE
jgi:hypothetical protein